MTPALPIVYTQLLAMRQQLEAAILLCEAELRVAELAALEEEALEESEAPERCPHPPGRQRSATVMGGTPMLLCLDCEEEHPGTMT